MTSPSSQSATDPLADWLPEDDHGRVHGPNCENDGCDGRCVPPLCALCDRRHWNACPALWGGDLVVD